MATLCKRFAAVLRRCDVETFLNMGRLYPEIAPLEKRINMHIDLLRRDEFKVMECVSDIVKCVLVLPEPSHLLTTIFRIQSQFDHLAETYFSGFDTDLAEQELGYVTAFDHDLDMFAASIGLARTSVAALRKEEGMFGRCHLRCPLFHCTTQTSCLRWVATTSSKNSLNRLTDC